ncbi:hypothetical protein PPL_11859 [Heterostelium album PN500]|uniref:phosphoenolpyruvate carboxykinase (ATP) n=1 Tax=Heterostelium pallidum (strain ATCC 26659 / Pp 5 / PN500) TaxID=670386 RepID=D3BUN8_HETP5|nr:hypothetical protein PPL_11859 [Heterostelium album PN500]EFA74826.1 hypothetical protein PPL_11859 [Heterostelium album PN500]|eukprot:XP_020426960.1 hypothetical protein PPL_11859 [Heterostelium album PN500]
MFVVKRTSPLFSELINCGASASRRFYTPSSPLNSVYDSIRRKRERKGLVNIEKENESDTMVFPNERIGLDYALNWTLNSYAITPTQNAFRNPSAKLLFQYAEGTKEKSGALSCQVTDNKPVNYYLDQQVATLNQSASNVITIAQYKQLLAEVKNHISEADNIYVQDAAVGSHRACEGMVRVMTNCPQTALFLKHLLPNTPLPEVREFKHQITLYVAPNFKPADAAKLGLKDSAAAAGSFNVIDVKRGIAVIAGKQSSESIRRTLTAISSPYLHNERQGVAMSAADIFQTKDDKNILVFSADNYLLNKRFESGRVISQGSLWNKEGLFRLYDSISYPLESAAKQPLDLIEKFTNPKRVLSTVPIKSSANIYASPSSIVFLVRDSKGIIPAFAELTPEQAEKYFTSGFNGESFQPYFTPESITVSPQGKAELFKNLIQQNRTNVYIINPLSFQKDADVDKLISVISSGKVNKSTKSDIYKSLSPINLSETKVSEVDKNKVKEFETHFENFHSKLFNNNNQ